MNDSVAILVPCYNAEAYLAQALDSALAQTHKAVQIIVVDDGSTDRSGAIAREYAARHPDADFVVIEQANAGEAAARNRGIAAATAGWIANLDADDWWEPRKLALQIAAARDAGPDCVLVHTAGRKVYPDGRVEQKPFAGAARKVGWCTETLIEPVAIGHPSCMYRRDAIDKIGGYDPAYKRACDMDMYMRLSAVGAFSFVPHYLVNYRAHANQLSAVPVEQIRERDRAIRRFFDSHPDKLAAIGEQRVHRALAEHAEIKLESLWWRRQLPAFRDLLDYVEEARFDTPAIRAWMKKARWPDWLIRVKDWVDGKRGNHPAAAPVSADAEEAA